MTTRRSVEVYRNLTRRAWSLRVGGRVVGHVAAIALREVVLRASDASRLRCVRLGIRDVHAFARGIQCTDSRPPTALRFRYRLSEPGFRLADGRVVTAADAAWFEADGSAWCLASAGANVTLTEGTLRLRDLTPDEIAAIADRRAIVREALGDAADGAPFLDAWETVAYLGSDRIALRGLCWGERPAEPVAGLARQLGVAVLAAHATGHPVGSGLGGQYNSAGGDLFHRITLPPILDSSRAAKTAFSQSRFDRVVLPANSLAN